MKEHWISKPLKYAPLNFSNDFLRRMTIAWRKIDSWLQIWIQCVCFIIIDELCNADLWIFSILRIKLSRFTFHGRYKCACKRHIYQKKDCSFGMLAIQIIILREQKLQNHSNPYVTNSLVSSFSSFYVVIVVVALESNPQK